jgi:putative transposase
MEYHVVWITKYRYKVLVEGVKEYVEVNIQPDHVHRVVGFPPKYSIARIVQIIKTNTSRGFYEKFKFLRERYRTKHVWSIGYYVSTVGLDEERDKAICKISGKRRLGTSGACILISS